MLGTLTGTVLHLKSSHLKPKNGSDSLNCGAESAEVEGMVVGFCRVFSMLNPFSLDSLC